MGKRTEEASSSAITDQTGKKQVPSPFTRRVIDILRNIPYGRVTTYGVVALHAGNVSGARQVARILHSSSARYDLPWHRVINREGKISLHRGNGYERQELLLRSEGIVFDEGGTINLDRFLWWPGKEA